MAEYIDKGAVIACLAKVLDDYLLTRTCMELNEVPPEAMVEIVRCRDCGGFEKVKPSGKGYCHCTGIGICNIVYQDDFCSNGWRKQNE